MRRKMSMNFFFNIKRSDEKLVQAKESNMKRISIRNNDSIQKTKPRLFDVIIEGDAVEIEVKKSRSLERISLKELLKQIDFAKKSDAET